MEKKTIDVKEFAKIYGIGITSAYNIVRYKDFPKIKVGKKIIIFKDEIDIWFRKHQGESFTN